MDLADARRAVDDLRSEITVTELRLSALRKLVEGYCELFPVLAADRPEDAGEGVPKGQDAVRRIMMEFPGRWFTVAQMVDELQRRGWLPESDDPANPVRTALTRVQAADPDNIEKGMTKDGVVAYGYMPSHLPTPGTSGQRERVFSPGRARAVARQGQVEGIRGAKPPS